MDTSGGGFRLAPGIQRILPPNNQPMLFRPQQQQQQFQQTSTGLPSSSQQQLGGGTTPLVTPASLAATGNIMQAPQSQQQQQQQFSVAANSGAPTLLAAIKAMQAAAAAQGKTLAALPGPNNQQQTQVPAQAMPAPPRQPSGLQPLPARPQQQQQQQQRRPAASQPSAPPASKDHQALLQQVQAALAKIQQQQQQQQQQQSFKAAPQPPAGFSAELPTASRAAVQGQEAAAAAAGQQRPRMASDELLQLVQAHIQKQVQQQQQQRAPAGPAQQPSNATVAAPAAGQRPPAPPGMNPTQQQLLQQVLAVVAANTSSSSSAQPAARAPGASATQQQQPAAAAGAHTAPLPPGFGAGLTPQQQQLLQQMLSASGVSAASAGSGLAGPYPSSQAGARMSSAAPAAGGPETAGVMAGQPAAAPVGHTVATPHAGQQQGTSSIKGLDMAALLQQVLPAASVQRPPNGSTANSNKGIDQQASTRQQHELQPEELSTEVLTLLTMIAASAVYGAAESSASGRPLSAAVNPRVLAASKRFLSILVPMNDSSSTDGEEALEAMAAAAAGVPRAGGGGAATDAHVAAAALCSLPDPPKGGGDGGPGWGAGVGGEEHGEWYAPEEPLVGGSRRKRRTAGNRTLGGRPPAGYSRGTAGANKQQGSSGGRSGLLALLRAVEETDQGYSDPEEDPMDWGAAGAAAAADVGAEDDQPDRAYGAARGRRARGKRPRYSEHSSMHSDSWSYDSSGQDSRRWGAAAAAAARSEVGWSDREWEQGEQEEEGARRQRQRTGYTHGRIRRTKDDNYIYGDALDSVADAALLAATAGAAAGGQRGGGKPGPKAAAGAAARAPSPAVMQQGPKRQRCVAGANQWVTEDGLTVWPKDTVVTRDQRVFYVAFKWVQEHWPRNVQEGEHIADVPISLFLDNQEVPNLVYNFKAKIRVYNTAAHLVISPYSKLSSVYSGCYIAGYAYNHHTGAIRVYLTREKPDLSAPPGRPISQHTRDNPADAAVPRQHHIPPTVDPAAAAAMPAPAPAERSGGDTPAAADTELDRAFAAAMAVADELPQLQALVNAVDAQDAAAAAGMLPDWAAAAAPAAQAMMADGVAVDDNSAGSKVATAGVAAAAGKEQQQQPEEMQVDTAAAAAGAPVAASPSSGVAGEQQERQPDQQEQATAGKAAAPVGGAPSSGLAGKQQERQQLDQQQQEQVAADGADAPPLSPKQAASGSSSDVGGSEGVGPDAQRWEQLQQQLGALQARDVPVDASVINNAVLSVSDALQLPDDLLAELPNRLLQTLQAATAPGSSIGVGSQQAGRHVEGPAAADGDGSDAVAQAGSDSGKGGPPSPDAVLAAMQGWYQRLCGAVAARDGQQVTRLVKQLGHEVLVSGQ